MKLRHTCLLFAVLCIDVLGSAAHAPAADSKSDKPKSPPAGPTHPIVPTFERFFAAPDQQQPEALAEGGRLLLGELSCTKCHQVDKPLAPHFIAKAGPNLNNVAERARTAWLRRYLADPHGVKPGATMPDVLAHLPAAEKAEQVEALTHYLVSLASKATGDQIPDRAAASRGLKLLNQIGCLACHDAPDAKERLATSIPWGNLAEKYTASTLSKFLADPHAARPAGRMPKLGLTNQEANDIAHYFLRDVEGEANLRYEAWRRGFESVDELAQKEPKSRGESLGFNLDLARRDNDFGMRFTGYLRLEAKAEYTFYLTSDDGSRLTIDGVRVVDNDGLHATQTKDGLMILDRGSHEVVVEYFNGGGEGILELEFESPNLPRGDIVGALSLARDGEPPSMGKDQLVVDPKLAARGRELFARQGCANCHEVRHEDQPIASTLKAPSLVKAGKPAGCLAVNPSGSAPRFGLSTEQRKALHAALISSAPSVDAKDPATVIARTLLAFNCHACHQRDSRGGVEPGRDDSFLTSIKEMGDEGRLPPALTGVGLKLTRGWLERVLKEGTVLVNKQKTRPYMHTRMPAFGEENVKPLVEAFDKADTRKLPAAPTLDEPDYLTKDQGRLLAGSQGFSCIKCHTFGKYQAEGIQSIDMGMMSKRLRREWFAAYVRDPPAFRLGTRMPSAWPKTGKSVFGTMYEGDSDKQIAALWIYLLDGEKARPPQGVGGQPIELVAKDEPIVYRNFIEGAGPRAIAVGYPEKLDLAFDAAQLRLALIWQGAFIDASRHWSGRSEGFQPPLGDRVIPLVDGLPLAALAKDDEAWPATLTRETDSHFQGYRLDDARRPTFLYSVNGVAVEDQPTPIVADKTKSFRRTLKLQSAQPAKHLYYRAALASSIEPAGDGWYNVDKIWKLRIESSGASPRVRAAGAKHELIVPVEFHNTRAEIIQTYQW
ncbi:MAG: c-type cytochrome [Planctomycetes bacterium]|nr:c-type cytochrome [Planctomycetota bacterium]